MAIRFRPGDFADIPAMAAIRSDEWGSEDQWRVRIGAYLRGEHSPRQALAARACFVAIDDGHVVGFAAGHLTRRFGCDGELQWMNVARQSRGRGIARGLIRELGAWFVEHGARRVCVDVEPENNIARELYRKSCARPLPGRSHWMVWDDCRLMIAGKCG